MEIIIGILGALLLSALGALVGAQTNASVPALARWIIQRAVQRLPKEMRDRYSEEWLRVIEEVPGPLLKLWTAFGFVFSIRALVRDHAGKALAVQSSGPRNSRSRARSPEYRFFFRKVADVQIRIALDVAELTLQFVRKICYSRPARKNMVRVVVALAFGIGVGILVHVWISPTLSAGWHVRILPSR